MELTSEQKQRKATELNYRSAQVAKGSLASVIEQHDRMVEQQQAENQSADPQARG